MKHFDKALLQRADASVDYFRSRRPVQSHLKRTLDISLTTLTAVVLSPLILMIALLIKLDSRGPVLYTQLRHGLNGQIFKIYKFRTMHRKACQEKFRPVRNMDARITRVGHILRQTGLDELPQIINVLNGDMSLVGPRPHHVAMNDEYISIIPNYAHRHLVKPGITGLAQIKGLRGPTPTLASMAKRVYYDIEYVHNWSIVHDLNILARTPMVILFPRRGA